MSDVWQFGEYRVNQIAELPNVKQRKPTLGRTLIAAIVVGSLYIIYQDPTRRGSPNYRGPDRDQCLAMAREAASDAVQEVLANPDTPGLSGFRSRNDYVEYRRNLMLQICLSR